MTWFFSCPTWLDLFVLGFACGLTVGGTLGSLALIFGAKGEG